MWGKEAKFGVIRSENEVEIAEVEGLIMEV